MNDTAHATREREGAEADRGRAEVAAATAGIRSAQAETRQTLVPPAAEAVRRVGGFRRNREAYSTAVGIQWIGTPELGAGSRPAGSGETYEHTGRGSLFRDGDPNAFQWPHFVTLLLTDPGRRRSTMATRTRSTNTAPRRKLIRLAEVLELTGLSRSTVYKLKALGPFPQPVKIGPHAVRWYCDEVVLYINTRPRSGSRERQR